jgi:hypothetical protein
MPRTLKPEESLIDAGAREMGEWSCAPGGHLWLATAFRRLGDALAAPPQEVQREEAETAQQGAKKPRRNGT